ncbi:acyl-CoA dehydrogenase family member 11-like isoform X3 [Branchiostoma lanceolatum]|uniref:acyl-CoA dehydrogenase family member 11-like isoform X3 n=1 Tax=Branchiostoma lanceolatum TaxID=7740 RepID=UPI0034525628
MADTTELRTAHRFDVDRLHDHLLKYVPGFPQQKEQLVVRQFSFGQSNPTFYLRKGRTEYVMRKKPPGRLLKGAHMVEREYRIIEALHSVGFPVPCPILFCSDKNVIGTEFYIMEHVKGRVFRDVSLSELPAEERTAVYNAMAETLAQLHSVDWRKLKLQDFGKEGNYCKRQLSTWTRQYHAAATGDIPAMNQLIQWLDQNLPAQDTKTTIVHGDYKLDNMVFHPTEPRVIAVLDWELCTLGDPLTDLAYLCQPYNWPEDLPQLNMAQPSGSSERIIEMAGIPSQDQFVQRYCNARGLHSGPDNWEFYLALSFFKAASICQGVYKRALQGNASASQAEIFGQIVEPLAGAGVKIIERRMSVSPASHTAQTGSLLQPSPKGQELRNRVRAFLEQHVAPAFKTFEEQVAKDRWAAPPIVDEIRAKAKAAGLWNLFLPDVSGLSVLDYAFIAEETGRYMPLGPEAFNCQAPDTGNMETIHLYGSPEQKKTWLEPLLEGKIKSCFAMTEPDVASSDATNMQCSIVQEGNQYVINGKKWWTSGAGHPLCKVAVLMGKTGDSKMPRHRQHSMILVPMDAPGVKVVRALTVFGYDDAPHGHCEVHFTNVRVPVTNMLLGEGRGFEIAQGRLGPGRIHHCMRLIGMTEKALEAMCERAAKRRPFGKRIIEQEVVQHDIAEARMALEQARLLVLKAAHMIDTVGTKKARKEIAMIKIIAPRVAVRIIDRAIQVHGGAGVCQDFSLAGMYAGARTIQIADGPDEVHLTTVAKMEIMDQLKKAKM